MDINRIPECDPAVARYAVVVATTVPVPGMCLTVTRFYAEWEYATNVYEAYRQALKPEFQKGVRLIRMDDVIEPGEIMDWN